MKCFWIAGVLGVLLCAPSVSAKADGQKIPGVTRDNFVSLDYQSVGGFAALKTQVEVQGNQIILEEFPRLGGIGLEDDTGLFSGQRIAAARPSAWLSNNQLRVLINSLNRVHLPALAGKYKQSDLRDGLNETLSLTISDEKDKDQTFVIENYGNKAPAGFYQIVAYLRQLRVDKFRGASEAASTETLVTHENLRSVVFEISGGFAGLRDKIEIAVHRPTPSSYAIPILRTLVLGGRTTNTQQGVEPGELQEFIGILNAANLPKLSGQHYEQKQLRDGFNEQLTVTLTDGESFTVFNYGDTAPPEYFAITRFLNELKNKKFNNQ